MLDQSLVGIINVIQWIYNNPIMAIAKTQTLLQLQIKAHTHTCTCILMTIMLLHTYHDEVKLICIVLVYSHFVTYQIAEIISSAGANHSIYIKESNLSLMALCLVVLYGLRPLSLPQYYVPTQDTVSHQARDFHLPPQRPGPNNCLWYALRISLFSTFSVDLPR